MEACEWTFASGILASHLSVHSITFNQHQVSQPNPVPHCAPENTLWAMQQSHGLLCKQCQDAALTEIILLKNSITAHRSKKVILHFIQENQADLFT